MSDLIELKPCPFCGGEGESKYLHNDFEYMVICNSCGGAMTSGKDETEAVKAWNTRQGEDK